MFSQMFFCSLGGRGLPRGLGLPTGGLPTTGGGLPTGGVCIQGGSAYNGVCIQGSLHLGGGGGSAYRGSASRERWADSPPRESEKGAVRILLESFLVVGKLITVGKWITFFLITGLSRIASRNRSNCDIIKRWRPTTIDFQEIVAVIILSPNKKALKSNLNRPLADSLGFIVNKFEHVRGIPLWWGDQWHYV